MDVLREYLWLWVICGVFLLTMVIIFIFLLINQWISRRGKHRISKLQRGTLSFVEGNNYQERSPSSVTPPLPPRTQFLSEESQSYENLAEPQDNDYEEAQMEYEQATDAQFDYVKVEDERDLFPPPPPQNLDPDADNDDASTEDYDDIGGEDEHQDEEDYDDVG
ncbi:uncharacterized protein [Paralichthys olivaceus]|uniref:uncharacterized protein n=1 Tax=Paralichthys olivaceus TaxID=8255 RepID=UPI003751C0B2